MKVFYTEVRGGIYGKVNFVDENNVFVGYDMRAECCEYASWFIADSICERMPSEMENGDGLESFNFDPDFFEEKWYLEYNDGDYNVLDKGYMIIFRMTDGSREKYLHIFNCQNGYYSHGFTMKVGGKTVRDGDL